MRQRVISNLECSPQKKTNRNQRILIWTIFSMLILILITRVLSLKHGMVLHPDEWVFFNSASSLFPGRQYQVYKTYPEGAFLLQMPFQMIRQLALRLIQFGGDVQKSGAHLVGRISSVVYFSLGAALGCTFLYLTQKKTLPILCFAVIMTFSLFQIEQSRYSTGEAPSFFLIMAILNVLVLYLRGNRFGLLCIAAFFAGILGAVKYPQIYFVLLPVCAAILNKRNGKTPPFIAALVVLLCSALGFVCFSPSIFQPGFLSGIIARETDAYVVNPNLWSAGTPPEHFVSLLIYHMLYADIPLAPLFALFGIFTLFRKRGQDGSAVFLRMLPFIMLGFFLYNLFIPTLFFRTYYLYFCVCILYTCIGLSELLERKIWKQLIIALLCIMVLRGGYFVGLLSQPQKDVGEPLVANPNWSEQAAVTVLGNAFVYGEIPGEVTRIDTNSAFLTQTSSLDAGEFCVTGPYQFAMARTLHGFVKNASALSITDGWNSFRDQNATFLFHKLYPDDYYILFGLWLEGNTGTPYEFPSVYFYYKP